MVLFVAWSDSLEDLDRVILGGFVDHHALETAFKCGVLLDGLVVFLQCRCADDLYFATGERRFEDVCGIHCAFRAAGSDKRMYLVQKENAVFGVFRLFDKLFQTLLELAAVHGPRDDARHVK